MIPEYSDAAREALGTVVQGAYQVLIYFEDAGKEALYEEIVERLTENYREVRVICLNGKDSLLNHRIAPENKRMQVKTLYVLDKDLDDLLKKKRRFGNFFYLPQYAIKNLFIEETPLLELAKEEKPGQKNLQTLIGIGKFLIEVYPLMKKLVALYLLVQEYSLPLTNTSEPIQRRTRDKAPWSVCDQKIDAYSDLVFNLLLEGEFIETREEYEWLLQKRMQAIRTPHDIPGKQLVDLVRTHLSNSIGVRPLSVDSFCFRLAKKCNFDGLQPLKDVLTSRLVGA